MRKRLLVLLLLAIPFSFLQAQTNAQDSIWVFENYTKTEQMIPMRDGVRLFTAIYTPKDTKEKHPFLMERTPYSCRPYGKEQFHEFWNSYQMAYLKEGYIMVIQ